MKQGKSFRGFGKNHAPHTSTELTDKEMVEIELDNHILALKLIDCCDAKTPPKQELPSKALLVHPSNQKHL